MLSCAPLLLTDRYTGSLVARTVFQPIEESARVSLNPCLFHYRLETEIKKKIALKIAMQLL
jgi:hypothetical protein